MSSLFPSPTTAKGLISRPSFSLSGIISAPGDKSVSHRALILGALAQGTTLINGLLEGHDVLATAAAMQALGANVQQMGPGQWQVTGVPANERLSPKKPIDFGNAGTGVRLCMGLVAGQSITANFIGDESLSRRPMGRVLEPLMKMGATTSSHNGCLPVTIQGCSQPLPTHHTLPVASAQVKSAILLAALNCDGTTIVDEPGPSRDHTENMLQAFGAELDSQPMVNGGRRITLHGPVKLQAQNVTVPGDPSSAAFAVIAALIVPGSDVTITNVMMNPTRNGLIETLQQAGYDIRLSNTRQSGGETLANIRVLAGCKVPLCPPPARAVTMIDEYPVLMVLAAFAHGTSRFDGIGELRVKESDRIEKMAELLQQNRVKVRTGDTWMEVDGRGTVFGPANIPKVTMPFAVDGDHRIAMSALVLGLGGFLSVAIDDADVISTSYPNFLDDMAKLGADIRRNSQHTGLVIAVDGPLASGKGTLARRLAEHLDLPYLDTGLLYRATARAALDAKLNFDEDDKLAQLARDLTLPIPDIDDLRSAEIGAAASKVAAKPKVRAALLELQQTFAAQPSGAVLDGRDIGTVVCPNADVKLWVTASEHLRAKRRQLELTQNGKPITFDEMLAQLRERDARDGARSDAPMQQAENAYLIDTSNLSIDAALQVACDWVERKLADRL